MSKETEVNKYTEWLKEEVNKILRDKVADGINYYDYMDLKRSLNELINQLDKIEVLSQDWIDKHSYNIEEYWEIADMMPEPQYAVSVENLQNLLVSNKKELDQAYKDGHDKGIELMEVMMMEYEDGEFWENEKMKKCIEWLKELEYSNRKDLEE